jgi:hypothetical protein
MQFYAKPLVSAKADAEVICGRLMFDAVVSGRLILHSAQSPYEYTTAMGATYALV